MQKYTSQQISQQRRIYFARFKEELYQLYKDWSKEGGKFRRPPWSVLPPTVKEEFRNPELKYEFYGLKHFLLSRGVRKARVDGLLELLKLVYDRFCIVMDRIDADAKWSGVKDVPGTPRYS